VRCDFVIIELNKKHLNNIRDFDFSTERGIYCVVKDSIYIEIRVFKCDLF